MNKALSPARRRIRWQRGVHGLILGFALGAAACLALVALSFFIPIESLWKLLLLSIAAPPPLLLLLSLFLPVTPWRAAQRVDALGLKERARTALSFEKEESAMHALQRRDAIEKLAAFPLREAMPVRVSRRLSYAAVCMAVLSCAMLFLPNPQNEILEKHADFRRNLHAQAELLEAVAESVDEKGLTDAEKREVRKITGDMARDLRAAKDEREAMTMLGEKQQALEKLQKEVQQRTAAEVAKALAGQPGLLPLSQAMEAQSQQQIETALEGLSDQLEGGGAKSLAEALLQAAAQLPEGAAQQTLLSAAQMALTGNFSGAIGQLMQLTSGSALSGSNLAALAQLVRAGLTSGNALSGTEAAAGLALTPGGGKGPGKAGTGTSNLDAGYNPGFSESEQGESESPSQYVVGAYERIYDPSRIGGDADPTQVTGQMGEGASSQIQLGPGMGDLSGQVPYSQVIGEYSEAAAEAMQRTTLPATLQDFVTRYFNALID